MTDVNDILNNALQWTIEGITKPSIKTGQIQSIKTMNRGIVVKIVNSDDELIGVIDRHAYSIDSHEIWICAMVSSTSQNDLTNIIGCVKRICAEHEANTAESHLEWQGGDYKIFNNKRFEFFFAIMRKKSMRLEF
jgi:poly-beta-hydroxyalkanoate depolymerase